MLGKKHRFNSWSLKQIVFLSLSLFAILFVCTHLVSRVFSLSQAKQSLALVESGLASELKYLLAQGNELAQDPLLKKYILTNNSYNILGLLANVRDRRELSIFGVTNAQGFNIARSRAVVKRGDNTFITTPHGRIISSGNEVTSIEINTVNHAQLIMIAGRPVWEAEQIIGGVTNGYLLDDNYAKKFVAEYLGHGEQLAFYTTEYGLSGTSFTDQGSKKMLSSYFNPESEWIKNGRSEDLIRLGFGKYYLVKNIVFPGLEHSPGGVLVFVPYNSIARFIQVVVVLIALLVFLMLVVCQYRHKKNKHLTSSHRLRIFSAFTVLILLIIIILSLPIDTYLKLQHLPYVLYNSTIRLQPEAGIFSKNFERNIAVLVDTGEESVNTVVLDLSYDPEILMVEAVTLNDSFCTLVIENKIDNELGKLNLTCGVPSPGFSGKSGNLANILVEPKKAGVASFIFNSGTKVLANDGLGTDVLRFASNGSYNIEPDKSIIVFSSTHPNSERWYSNRAVDFNWSGQALGTSYAYSFDNNPNSVPSLTSQITGSKITVTAPQDGIFYFHLAPVTAGRLGSVTTYKVQIDTTPPAELSIKASATKIQVGEVIRLAFSARDDASGLQNFYYISFGDSLFLPVGQQTYIPFTSSGAKNIKLRIYDYAGNYSEQALVIKVSNGSIRNYWQSLTNSLLTR